MNHNIVSYFLYGPIFYSAFGYWMYSVPALLSNEVSRYDHLTNMPNYEHKITPAFTSISPATPFLFLFVFTVISKIDFNKKLYMKSLNSSKYVNAIQKMKELNHKIDPDFYDALS